MMDELNDNGGHMAAQGSSQMDKSDVKHPRMSSFVVGNLCLGLH